MDASGLSEHLLARLWQWTRGSAPNHSVIMPDSSQCEPDFSIGEHAIQAWVPAQPKRSSNSLGNDAVSPLAPASQPSVGLGRRVLWDD